MDHLKKYLVIGKKSLRGAVRPRDRGQGRPTVRMTGSAAAPVSFAEASGLLAEMAGVRVEAKQVERVAEALGREIAAAEREGTTSGMRRNISGKCQRCCMPATPGGWRRGLGRAATNSKRQWSGQGLGLSSVMQRRRYRRGC